MASRFRLVVFDWDGTLMDSTAVIAAAIQSACGDLGLPVPSDSAARFVIGLGLGDALRHVAPELEERRYPELSERYRHHFLQRDAEATLFPGAAELVRELHDRKLLLAIATGKSRRGLDRALGETALARYFHATRCADEGLAKPHPAMLLHLVRQTGVGAGDTLMVGDTTHDLDMARSAAVASVGVTHGAHSRERLLESAPLACVDDVDALGVWLRDHT